MTPAASEQRIRAFQGIGRGRMRRPIHAEASRPTAKLAAVAQAAPTRPKRGISSRLSAMFERAGMLMASSSQPVRRPRVKAWWK
ncbi:hypothetical protein D3C80_2001320 [compost metagenome]